MKICFINDSWTPIWGGGPTHIWEVANRLVKSGGFEVDVIVPVLTNKSNGNFPKIGNYLNNRLRIIGVGRPSRFPSLFGRINFLFSAFKYCLKNNYDIYHAQYILPALILPIIKIFKNKKTAFTLHGQPNNMLGGGILNVLKISQIFSFIVLRVIPYDLRFTVSKSSINDSRYKYIGNGVDVSEFNKYKSRPAGEAGIKDKKKFRIFWIGRKYDPIKGLKYLEKAVSGLDVILDIAENVYGDEKIKRFRMADLFVLPSLSEGLPIVLLEAMAARLPVIVTDVGDCRSIVEEAKAGLVVRPADVESLKKAITSMMKNTGKYGDNGYEFVGKNYTWEKVIDRMNNYD